MSLFEIDYRDNLYYFTLKDDCGEVMLRSKGYIQKQSCKDGIHTVKMNIGLDARIQIDDREGGNYFFNVVAINGKIVAQSKKFASMDELEQGLVFVRTIYTI